MSADPASQAAVHTTVHTSTSRSSGVFALFKVVLLLVLWVCGFVAFLVAPLFVLALAWVAGVAWLAYRHRGNTSRRALPSGEVASSAHQFGAAFPGRGDAEGDAA